MTPLLFALCSLAPTDGAPDPAWLHVRDGLPWTRFAMERADAEGDRPVRVAFIGGSITEGNGYRPLVEAKLRAKYPDVTWEFHNAGVSSTGSTTGVFRYLSDAVEAGGAWEHGATLVIAEAAVNDDQDERLSAADAGWGMEGIARMTPIPMVYGHDVMFVHFPNPSIVEKLRAGEAPISVAAHERVAERYAIPSVNVAAEVARRIDAGTLTWEQYGGTHPGPVGHELAAGMIVDAIDRGMANAKAPRPSSRWIDDPLRPDALDAAMMADFGDDGDDPAKWDGALEEMGAGDDWTVGIPDWTALPGNCRGRFKQKLLLHTATPGAKLEVTVERDEDRPLNAVGLYVLAGPDAGAVEVTVPGEEPRVVQLYHDPHSKGLHYPRTVLLYRSDKPPPGPVTVKVVKGERGGTAVRIVGVGLGFITRERGEADTP